MHLLIGPWERLGQAEPCSSEIARPDRRGQSALAQNGVDGSAVVAGGAGANKYFPLLPVVPRSGICRL